MKIAVVLGLGSFGLVGCGAGDPGPQASAPVSIAPITAAPAPTSQPSPEPTLACTMTKAFSDQCAPCFKAHCCAPPAEFVVSTAQALGCHIGCRKPLFAPAPTLSASDRALVVQTCLTRCDEIFPDQSGDAARLDACIAGSCNAECLVNP